MAGSWWRVGATLAWVVTAAFIAGPVLGLMPLECGMIGLAFSAIAATLSIRGFCFRLQERVEDAFDLGRDVGRSDLYLLPDRADG